MTIYINEPITVDRSSLRAAQDTAAVTAIPGLKIAPGTPIDLFSDLLATDSAELRQLITQVLLAAFRANIEKVDRILQRAAVQATGTSSWTRSSTTGARTVLAGTEIDVPSAGADPVTFQTVADFTFPDGTATVADVDIIASAGGDVGNGLSGAAAPTSTLIWLDSITVDASTSGGADAEDLDTFINRAADTKPGRAFTIVKAEDAARFLRNETGVYRALVLDNYNPDTGDTAAGGHMTVIPMDPTGASLDTDTMAALRLEMQAICVSGGTIHMRAPTDNAITIHLDGISDPGFDPTDVQNRTQAAVQTMLSRLVWGQPDFGDTPEWDETLTLYHQDVSTVVNNVQGFARWTTLTINGVAGDLTLTGPGALPNDSPTVTVAVSAP